ncbi:MAG: hypothetical protein WAN43_16090 [Rhodomicrobium sp.]
MPTKSIFIAVPAYGDIAPPTMISLLRARDEARQAGWQCDIHIRPGDSMIHRARNAQLTEFLASDATDLLFWDADIAAAPGVFTRLMSHPVDFVGGAYRFRSGPEDYPIRWRGTLTADPATRLLTNPGLGLPAGFLRVTRAAIERMIAFFPDLWVRERDGSRLLWLFDFLMIDHEAFSEDFIFCQRWREAGGAVWLDPSLLLHHTGSRTVSGAYTHFLGRQLAARTTKEELAEAQRTLDSAVGSRQ